MPGRVFAAIELPPAARELLSHSMDALLAGQPVWRGEKPVAAGLLHCTVAFLGAVPDTALADVLYAMGAAAASVEPFEMRLEDIRAVPSARRASMVWATLSGDADAAGALAAAVGRATGLMSERPFRPHVTLARARRTRSVTAEALEAARSALSDAGREADRIMSVRRVTVFASTLGSEGPSYERLAELPLGRVRPGLADD